MERIRFTDRQTGAGTRNGLLAVSADQIGIWASTLCMVHCILTPIALSLSAVFAHFLPSEERTHRVLAVLIALIGAAALVRGFRIHQNLRVPAFMTMGLIFIVGGAWWGDRLPSHSVEVIITLVGSAFMIAAHRINHTFCRDCQCATAKKVRH